MPSDTILDGLAAPNDSQQDEWRKMFCQECCQLLDEISSPHCKQEEGTRDHHQSYLAYAEAVGSRCNICVRLPFQDEKGDEWSLDCAYSTTTRFKLRFRVKKPLFESLPPIYVLPALRNSGMIA